MKKKPARPSGGKRRPRRGAAARLLAKADASLLDVVDNLLNRGVLLTGDVVLGVADVDLVFMRLSLLLGAADRLFSPPPLGDR